MIETIDYRTSEIGIALDFMELRSETRAVCGGVAWPGKREGFVLVLAMGRKKHLGGHDIYLLDEYESFDTNLLVKKIGALDVKYKITIESECEPDSMDEWIGDDMNEAADKFIEMRNEKNKKINRPISLCPSSISEIDNIYSYLLPQIKDLLKPERRRLFLKNSKILDYLSEIEEEDINEFKAGEYPAIEALGITAIEMVNKVKINEESYTSDNHYKYYYDPLDSRRL